MSQTTDHGVDEVLPPQRLAALGIQHVLVMYAGAVAVPFIISGALGLSPEQRTLLINADLFACGLATIVQSLGFPGVGIRLPVMMGVTFASVAPMLAMIGAGKAAGATPVATLLNIYGAVIASGVFAFLVAPLVGRLIRFFPPVVTGTIIAVIGITLMRIEVAGRAAPCRPSRSRSTACSATSRSRLRPPRKPRHRGHCSRRHSADLALRQGLLRQYRGSARHHRRRCRRAGARQGEHGPDRQCAVVRIGLSLPVRHADLRLLVDRHHVHRHDRGHGRIHRHVPRARRNDRQERRIRKS